MRHGKSRNLRQHGNTYHTNDNGAEQERGSSYEYVPGLFVAVVDGGHPFHGTAEALNRAGKHAESRRGSVSCVGIYFGSGNARHHWLATFNKSPPFAQRRDQRSQFTTIPT